MKKYFFTLLILSASILSIHAQTILTLHPIADAAEGFHDNFNSATTNYGTVDNEQAFMQPGASGGFNGGRSVINFDFSSIPNGTVISSAKLNFYGHGPWGSNGQAAIIGSTGQNSCLLQRITSSWNELTTTWNTQPSTTNLNEVTLSASTSVAQDYLNIDVTQLVQDMLNNSSQSFGFMMRLVDESLPARALDFCSREYPDSSKRPVLVITLNCNNATLYNLNPTADAPEGFHDNFNSATTNFGTVDNEQAFMQPGASGGSNGGRTVINFDFSSIPTGTIISSAYLNLYGHGPWGASGQAAVIGSTGQNACLLQQVTSSWNELTTTWNTQPTTTTQNEVTIPASINVAQDYLNIDVTQLVQDMINNPATSFGFMLRLVDESLPARALDFCSREYADSSKHPLLTISVCGIGESINENILQPNDVIVYPNPTQDIMNVFVNQFANYHIAVYNCFGQKVCEQALSNQLSTINMKSFARGIYFYSILKNGDVLKNGKIVLN